MGPRHLPLRWFAAAAVLLAAPGAWAVDGRDTAEPAGATYRGRVELRTADGEWHGHPGLELRAPDGELELAGLAGGSPGRVLRLETPGSPDSPAPVLRLSLVDTGDGGGRIVAAATTGITADRIGLATDDLRALFTRADPHSADLELLASWLVGSFSNAAQALADPETPAVDLHLAPIWPDRADGPWRYLEQAVPEHPDSPYRQRVLRLAEPTPGLLEIEIWTLPEPAAAVGAWRCDEPLADLAPGSLRPRTECSILVRRQGDIFEGSTIATLCSSRLREASYATSEVAVTADGLVSWDRGFAADGRQVWGRIDGGLVFDRVVASPEPATEFAPGDGPGPDGSGDGGSGSDSDSDSDQGQQPAAAIGDGGGDRPAESAAGEASQSFAP